MRSIAVLAFTAVLGTAFPALADDVLPPQIVHEPCEQYKKGDNFEVQARFNDDSPIFDPKVIYRIVGDTAWKNAPFTKDPATGDFKALIRAKDLKGPLEYFIEAFDENGNGPARYGSTDAPIKVVPALSPPACDQVPEVSAAGPSTSGSGTGARAGGGGAAGSGITSGPGPGPAKEGCDADPRPVYCEPLLWGVVGTVVLAGAGLATYMIFFSGEEPEVSPARGTVNLHVSAPDPVNSAIRVGGP